MVRLVKGIKYAAFWNIVRSAMHSNDFRRALNYLDKLDHLKLEGCPKYFLVRAVVLFALGNDAESIDNLSEALKVISLTSRYNENEKIYMETYAKLIIGDIVSCDNGDIELPKCLIDMASDIHLQDVSMDGVRKDLIEEFPLRQ